MSKSKGTVSTVDPLQAALDTLAAARRAREAAELAEQTAVAQARAAGASWTRIGAVYGLTKQGAQQRFKQPTPSTSPDR